MSLRHSVHVDVHGVLDLPQGMLGRLVRTYRKKSNGLPYATPDMILYSGEMQRRFLENCHQLPQRIQHKYIKSLRAQVKEASEEYEAITGDWLGVPRRPDIHFLHETLVSHRVETAKAIMKALQSFRK